MSLAELGWRTFNFFNIVPVLDPSDSSKKASILQGLNLLCWAPGNGFVIFGEQQGAVFHVSRSLEVRFWKAFQKRLFDFAYAESVLVTIGEDDSSLSQLPLLKVWDLADNWDEASTTPKCRLNCQVNIGGGRSKMLNSQAAFVVVNRSLHFLAIGFADTSVFYFSGDFQRERSPKFKSLREGANALGDGQLAGLAVGTVGDKTCVFVVTDKSLSSYILSPNGTILQTILHDAKGCNKNCWYLSEDRDSGQQQLVVAGREMVYFYDLRDCLETGAENGRCHALSRGSDKLQVLSTGGGGHVALLTQQTAHIQTKSDCGPSLMSVLNVYDVEHRYIAFFGSMPSLCQLFTLDGEIYVLSAEGMLSKLVEEPLSTKLDILLKKNLFDLAISLARKGKSMDLQKSIYLKYGDYLYKKGDFENAIQQYSETIGHVEPSYIIKKFLDGPRIAQLCIYLELLHQRGLAIGQHTTLLLSAYVKMNATDKLDTFADKFAPSPEFDIDVALKILRSARLFKVAARLALKHQRPETFLTILIEDTNEFSNALNFISKLPTDEMCKHLEQFGSRLLEHNELETLELVKKAALAKDANIHPLMSLLLSRPVQLEELFREVSRDGEIRDPLVRNQILEQKLQRISKREDGKAGEEELEEIFALVDADNYAPALHLAQIHKVAPLVVHILRKQNRMEELLRFLLQEGNVLDVAELCGVDSLKDIWIELITYVSAKEQTNKDPKNLIALLEKATQTNFIHPLVILEILSRNESIRIADVKEYVVRWLEQQNTTVAQNEAAIHANQKRLEEMNAAIDDLENNVQVFQVSKCSVCNNSLQVPAVHFLCKHSFHLNCYESYSGNRPDQCPACAATSDSEKFTSKHPSAKQQLSYQQFRHELENCSDAVSLISEYIAGGAFDQQNRGNNHPQ